MEKILQNEGTEVIFKFCCLSAGIFKNAIPDISSLSKADLAKLYEFSQKHFMTAFIYSSLEKTDASTLDPVLMAQWKIEKEKAIRRNLLFNAERQKLISFMENNKIWYVQLKGAVIKSLYPVPELRQMADNDILFDSRFRNELKTYFESNGYVTEAFEKECHDTYIKPPIYNFELHTSLFDELLNPVWNEYFGNINSRLLKGKSDFEKVFSYEDFYLYFITHSYKHYSTYGTGMRFLTDLYCIINKYYELIDKTYLNRQLKRLGVYDFENTARTLCLKLFDNPICLTESELDSEELKMLIYISQSGIYGIKSNKIKNEIEHINQVNGKAAKYTRLKYYRSRLFPDDYWYFHCCPFCLRHRWARPFYTAFRVVRAVVFRRKKLKKEYEILRNQ